MVVDEEPAELEETLINETNLSFFDVDILNSPSVRSHKSAAVRMCILRRNHLTSILNGLHAECWFDN